MGVSVGCTFVTSYENIMASILIHICRIFKKSTLV